MFAPMIKDEKTILIRADANTQVGSGHVMRCLALAQAWRKSGGNVTFLMSTKTLHITERLRAEGMDVRCHSVRLGSRDDALQTVAFARKIDASWIVLDGYQFGRVYQQTLKDNGRKLLCLDDYGHAQHYYADLILNQNIYARESMYAKRESYTQLLLGTRYALLRQEFLEWQGWYRVIPRLALKVLITLGGSDPKNVTAKAIEAVGRIKSDELDVIAVVGGNNPHYEALQNLADKTTPAVCLKQNVTKMPELMAWADVAVSSGGSTCWELVYMGLPSIILVLAENQEDIAKRLGQRNIAINLGWYNRNEAAEMAIVLADFIESNELREEMNQRARGLVDGQGTKRVIESMIES